MDSKSFELNETIYGRTLVRVGGITTDFSKKNYWAIYSSTHPFCQYNMDTKNYCIVGIDGLIFWDVWNKNQKFDFILTRI